MHSCTKDFDTHSKLFLLLALHFYAHLAFIWAFVPMQLENKYYEGPTSIRSLLMYLKIQARKIGLDIFVYTQNIACATIIWVHISIHWITLNNSFKRTKKWWCWCTHTTPKCVAIKLAVVRVIVPHPTHSQSLKTYQFL